MKDLINFINACDLIIKDCEETQKSIVTNEVDEFIIFNNLGEEASYYKYLKSVALEMLRNNPEFLVAKQQIENQIEYMEINNRGR